MFERHTCLLALASTMLTLSPVMCQEPTVAPGDSKFVGLPDYGVILSGDPNYPTITNNSSRRIIGYTLKFEDASGNGPVYRTLPLRARRLQPANAVINPSSQHTFSSGTVITGPGQTTPSLYTKVRLDAVLFEDGELVGPDTFRSFESMTLRITAERDLAKRVLAARNGSITQKNSVWSDVILLAKSDAQRPRGTYNEGLYRAMQSDLAQDLLSARDKRGEHAAYEVAELSISLPIVWRKK